MQEEHSERVIVWAAAWFVTWIAVIGVLCGVFWWAGSPM